MHWSGAFFEGVALRQGLLDALECTSYKVGEAHLKLQYVG